MKNINNYIGIPHRFNGDAYDGCDCIGLARLFYLQHGWSQDFTDGQEVTEDWQEKDKGRLFRYLKHDFTETKDTNTLVYGDVVLFVINGDYHMGIYLEYGRVLAMQAPVVEGLTTSTIYHESFWKPFFVRGYKR